MVTADQDISTLGASNTVIDTGLSVGGAFIPFIALIPLATSGLPLTIITIIGIFTGIISAVQVVIIVLLSLSLISNLFYHPDV